MIRHQVIRMLQSIIQPWNPIQTLIPAAYLGRMLDSFSLRFLLRLYDSLHHPLAASAADIGPYIVAHVDGFRVFVFDIFWHLDFWRLNGGGLAGGGGSTMSCEDLIMLMSHLAPRNAHMRVTDVSDQHNKCLHYLHYLCS